MHTHTRTPPTRARAHARTLRVVNECPARHYADLILRLQSEMRTELRRMEKERKAQEELVENLRDNIASQTVRNSETPIGTVVAFVD